MSCPREAQLPLLLSISEGLSRGTDEMLRVNPQGDAMHPPSCSLAIREAVEEIKWLRAEVERLRADNEKLRSALKPFAVEAEAYDPPEKDDEDDAETAWFSFFTCGNLRDARRALEQAASDDKIKNIKNPLLTDPDAWFVDKSDLSFLLAEVERLTRERDEARSKETDYREGFQEGWDAAHEGTAAVVKKLREALKEWDALIVHQFHGTRDAMSDMQRAALNTKRILDELDAREALEAKP